MPQLEDITDLASDATELLEAVGYLDVRDLLEAKPEELVTELVQANKALGIMSETPTEDLVEEWQRVVVSYSPQVSTSSDSAEVAEADEEKEVDVRETEIEQVQDKPVDSQPAEPVDPEDTEPNDEGEEEEEDDESAHAFDIDPDLVNFEDDPEVQEMLSISPEALPLDPVLIRRHKLAVADIPEGHLLTQCEGEVEINVMTTSRLAQAQRRETEAKRTGLMVSRIRNFEEASQGEHHVKPLDKGAPKDVVSVSEGLNAGLSPESRRFIRGVLHSEPASVRISAFFAVLVEFMFVAVLVGIPWLLIHEHITGNNVFWWVIGLSVGLVGSGLCYLFWGMGARCRVCGQRLFAPKKCLKNKKAHHIPVVGYIFPTALHAIFFKWFYCTYCGTAIRLKK